MICWFWRGGQFYLAVDLAKRELRWKRLIDDSDWFAGPMRFYLHEPYLLVLKKDFDVPALYLLDTKTGNIVWHKKDAGDRSFDFV